MVTQQQYQIGDQLIFWWFNESNQKSGIVAEIHDDERYTVSAENTLWVLSNRQILPSTDDMKNSLNAMVEM